MSDLLIRHLPGDTIQQAKALAKKDRLSLQEEVSGLLVQAIRFRVGKWSAQADVIRRHLAGKKKPHSDSAALLRKDRDR